MGYLHQQFSIPNPTPDKLFHVKLVDTHRGDSSGERKHYLTFWKILIIFTNSRSPRQGCHYFRDKFYCNNLNTSYVVKPQKEEGIMAPLKPLIKEAL